MVEFDPYDFEDESKSYTSKDSNEVIQSFVVFNNFRDVSSEYEMVKIEQNEELKSLVETISSVEECKTIGCSGDHEKVKDFIQILFQTGDCPSIRSQIDDKWNSIEEGLICFVKNQFVVFAHKCNKEQLLDKGPIDSSLSAVDYTRYLTDFCETIFIFPKLDEKFDKPLVNPFREKKHNSIEIFERVIPPNENFTIKQVNVECNLNFGDLSIQPTLDQLNKFYTFSQTRTSFSDAKTISVDEDILKGEKSYYFKFMQITKVLNYDEIWSYLSRYWIEEENKIEFENLVKKLPKLFEEFLPSLNRSEIKNTFEDFLNESLDEYFICLIENYEPLYFEYLWYFALKNEYNQKKVEDLYETYMEGLKFVDSFCEKKIYLQDIIKKNKLNKYVVNFRMEKKRQLLSKVFEYLSDKVEKYHSEKMRIDFQLQFFEINVVRGVDSSINCLKFSMKPFSVNENYTCLPIEQSSFDNYNGLTYFANNDVGFILFRDKIKSKSILRYFQNPNSKIDLPSKYQSLCSTQTQIILDMKSKSILIYDNEKQTADQGKYDSTNGKIQSLIDVKNLYCSQVDGINEKFKLESIKSACFIPGSDTILIIDSNHYLIEFNRLTESLRVAAKRINQGKSIEIVAIKPSSSSEDNNDYYTEVQTVPNGKCILLKCVKSIDIYDLNWNLIKSLPISESEFKYFKTFEDDISTFLVIIQNNLQKPFLAFELNGFSVSRKFEVSYAKTEKNNGFPIIDVFYLSQRKYGNQSSFIGSSNNQKLYIQIDNDENNNSSSSSTLKNNDSYKMIRKYFLNLNIKNTSLDCFSLRNIDDSSIEPILKNISIILSNDLKNIILTRVPIHAATIELSNLYPLQNGKNISDKISSWKCENNNTELEKESYDLLSYIVSLIQFGDLDKILISHKKPLKVIGIIGRQSSGKSYFLNRLTGSRFNVASSRCTDGIWLSLAFIEDQLFVVLDCEGLFSTKRNEIEEVKLCLALSAVCDVFLLNQDLSFNRYLNGLFKSFSKCCDRLKGNKLFKGIFMILIRDVSYQDAKGANTELVENIKQNKSSNLDKLFDPKIKGRCIHNFENPIFDDEVDELRDWILNDLTCKWSSGNEFLDSFKFVLAQIHIDDDEFLDQRRFKKAKKNLELEAFKMFENLQNNLKKSSPLIIKYESFSKNNDDELILSVDQSEISLKPNDEDLIDKFKLLLEEKFKIIYDPKYHNDWFRLLNNLIKQTFSHRIDFIIKRIEENFDFDESFEGEIKLFLSNLKSNLSSLTDGISICQNKCRSCERVCFYELNHSEMCSCGTDHQCKFDCSLCHKHNNYCVKTFGHSSEVHMCNNGHSCKEKCELVDLCENTCSLNFEHSNTLKHDCGKKHECKNKCQIENCEKTCSSEASKVHLEHLCESRSCISKCSIDGCSRICDFPTHNHDDLISKYKTSKLEDKNQLKSPESWKINSTIDYHVCSETDHICGKLKKENLCEDIGVCEIGFLNPIEKIWSNGKRSFPYTYYEPKNFRKSCNFKYDAYSITHPLKHSCMKSEPHRCNSRCPECKSFCQLPINHPEEYHYTNAHRNKECNIFVSRDSSKILVKSSDVGKVREYEVGESCQPEICSQSCENRGRNHFHLKECPGKDKCPSLSKWYVKHSDEKWMPFEHETFDLWLCEYYWYSLNWKPPVSDEVLIKNRLCSFICGHSDHDEELSFCNKTAWHKDPHEFSCKHSGCEKLQLVFCCDTTGSMGSYIEQSKSTAKKIISDCSSKIKNVQIGFVAYRDHPPQDNSYVTKFQDLTDSESIVSFINSLDASGGGDAPEAVLDGLFDSAYKTSWCLKKSTLKYIIHIADAPPHGREYTNGLGDSWSDGCPCGKTIDKIAAKLNDLDIRYKLMKIGTYVNLMGSIFRENINQYEESDLNSSLDLDSKVCDIISRDLLNNEVDLKVKD